MNDLIIEFAILTLLCIYLVSYYSGPSVSIHIKFWSVLTWILNFGMALLVPLDLYYSKRNQGNQKFSQSEQYKTLATVYMIFYWTVYILTWTVIPILQQWQNSGDLKSQDRLRRSFKTNGIFYIYLAIAGIIGLGFLILIDAAHGMDFVTYLKALAMALGIFLLMIFMGYAIVQIPRSLWLQSNNSDYLAYCYKTVQQLEDQLISAQFQFKKNISIIIQAKKKFHQNPIYLQYCQISLNQIPSLLKEKIPINSTYFLKEIQQPLTQQFTLEDIIQQHRLVKRNLALIRRLNKSINHYVDLAILSTDIQASKENPQKKIQTLLFQSSTWQWYWYIIIKPYTKKIAAIVYTLFAILVLICQTQVFLSNEMSLLGYLINFQNYKIQKMLSLIIIVLLSYMVYYSFFRLKLSNLYGLYRKESDGPSLMFATINFSRVGAALIFNFFDMLKVQGVFTESMNAPNMGVIGDWAIKGMPGVLWLIVLSHYFNLWGILMKKLGIQGSASFKAHQINNYVVTIPYLVTKRRQQLQKKRELRQINF